MIRFPRALFAALLALTSCLAEASTSYIFSYTFENGSSVSGSFSGTANGNLINDLSDIHFSMNGTEVTGLISGYAAPFDHTAAVASFDGTQNQFLFANGDFSSFFYSVDGGADYGPAGTNLYVALVNSGAGSFACDSASGLASPGVTCGGLIGSTARWSLSAAAVPEPGTDLLFGAGLAGLVWRRRRLLNAARLAT